MSLSLITEILLNKRIEQKHANYLPIPNSEKNSFSETCTGSFHPRRENFMHFSSQRGYWVSISVEKTSEILLFDTQVAW